MFGLLVGGEMEEVGWGRLGRSRFAQRSFRDVDWGAIATAGLNLTAGVIALGVKAGQQGSQSQQPASYQCPQGYYFDASVGSCVQPRQSGGLLEGVDPTTLAIGVGVLVLVLTSGKD